MKIYLVYLENCLRPRRFSVEKVFSSFEKARLYLLSLYAHEIEYGIFLRGNWKFYIKEMELDEE